MLINKDFPSPNFSKRNLDIEYIIVHFTEIALDEALSRLTDAEAEVSAHYLIKEDGEILQLVDNENVAWHAGKSYWHGQESLNQNSIGIELDNSGKEDFTKAQIDSCLELCKSLSKKYNIAKQNFIGHSDVAPDRKIDPGIFFDWQFFAKHELGIWHGLEFADDTKIIYNFGDKKPGIEIMQKKLAKLGYKIAITGEFDLQTNCVVRAFQSKFNPAAIKARGLEFYNNLESKYSWDNFSDEVLNKLV